MNIRRFMPLLLPLVGALCGFLAGPFFARANHTVQLAERIYWEDSAGLGESDWTLESQAFRDTGRPAEELFLEARQIERNLGVGGAFFGVWCGLVVSLKFFRLENIGKRDTYDIEPAECVACGRCFLACPRERQRLKELADTATRPGPSGEAVAS